jgi:hypothetical protein
LRVDQHDIAPLARRLAEENNVDWRRLRGSGDEGRVVERDVLEYLARVMAGEEPIDPTPEPVPDGMESWPEEDVLRYREGDDIVEPSAATSTVEDDIFLFEEAAGADGDEDAPFGDAADLEVEEDVDEEDLLVSGDDEPPAPPEEPFLDEALGDEPLGAGAAGSARDDSDLPALFADPDADSAPGSAEPAAVFSAEHVSGADWDRPSWRDAPSLDAEPSQERAATGGGPRLDAFDDDEPVARVGPELGYDPDELGPESGEMAAAEGAAPDTAAPDAAEPDAAEPDAVERDADEASAAEPDTAELEAPGLDTPEPGTAELDAMGQPDAGEARQPASESAEADTPAPLGEAGLDDDGLLEEVTEELLLEDVAPDEIPGLDGEAVADGVPSPASDGELPGRDGEPEASVVPPLVAAQPAVGPEAPVAAPALESHGHVWRRHVDLTALVAAQADLAPDLGLDTPVPLSAFLVRAAQKALGGAGSVALAVLEPDGVHTLPMGPCGGFAETVASTVAALTSSAPRGEQSAAVGEPALVVADLSELGVDDAVLRLGAPVLTLGRVLIDNQCGGRRAVLALAGDGADGADAARLLGRFADLLEAPVRVVL